MLRIPKENGNLKEFCKDLVDECMSTADERAGGYGKAAAYYYSGSGDIRAAIHNKVRTFIDRLAGFYYQPSNVRFNLLFDSGEPPDVLERGQTAARMLTAEYRKTDTDIRFSDAVTWSLLCGCYFLKHVGSDKAFKAYPVHPINIGVLSESTTPLEDQEAFVHVTYPTITRVHADLVKADHPRAQALVDEIRATRASDSDQQEPSYIHQMIVGGMQPMGDINQQPQAGGIVQVFPVPTPWRPQRRLVPTVKHCELWIRDRDRNGDYTCIQFIYGQEPIILEGNQPEKRNISGVPDHSPFIKVIADETPGYFWGRSKVADVQMLQDVISKRLRDLKVLWDRNVAAPKLLSGFTSINEEQYYKILGEGGFINDPNPNAKSQDLTEPPPQGYIEELELLFQLFDEAGGFSKVMTGQGESGVRAGVHAQTLVRTSSPALIDPATRIERQLADSGYLAFRMMQDRDATTYTTDSGAIQFMLEQLPEDFQVEVDSHSASPAFAEDSRQIAIALARAQAVTAEELIEMLHPPNAEYLLAKLRQRQAAQAKMQQEMMARGIMPGQQQQHGGRHGGGR